MKNSSSVNNSTMIKEYDAQIRDLIIKRDRLVNERDDLKRKNQENSNGYDSAVKTKNELQNVLNNITDYARTNKRKVDNRIKLLKNMYEFLERSTNQPKMQRQIEELNETVTSIKNTIEKVDGEINWLNRQIGDVEREIERIKRLKGELANGKQC